MLVYWRVTFILEQTPTSWARLQKGCISYNLGEKSAVELVRVFLPHVEEIPWNFYPDETGGFCEEFCVTSTEIATQPTVVAESV